MDRDAKIRVATAAVKALALWIAVYVALAHCFVVWKWQTPHYYLQSDAIASISAPTTIVIDPSVAAAAAAVEANTLLRLQQLDELAEKLQMAVDHSRQRNRAMEQQLSELGRLATMANEAAISADDAFTTDDDDDDTTTAAASTEKLHELLRRSNLSDFVSPSAIAESFALATAELEQLVVDRNWDAVAAVLNEDYPSRDAIVVETTATMSCRAGGGGGASQAQFDQAQKLVMDTFASQRDASVPVSFPETVAMLRKTLRAAVAKAASDASSAAASTNVQPPTTSSSMESFEAAAAACGDSCLTSEDQVLPWLEAGLDALMRHQDVRSALLKAMDADEIDTSKIILDADFPADRQKQRQRRDDDSDIDGPAAMVKINLRQLLDKPTLHESSAIVDWLLDFVSGKHDGLDDFMDKYVYANVPNDRDVGKFAVERLLKVAGKVNLPVPLVLYQNKAGALR